MGASWQRTPRRGRVARAPPRQGRGPAGSRPAVYCKDGNRRGSSEHTSFTFLGFTFRARKARSRAGKNFTNFLPAISKAALNKISGEVRRWRLHRRTRHSLAELAKTINPIVRGWMQY